jgi:hypothetical protein
MTGRQKITLSEKKQQKEDILDFWKANQVPPGSIVWSPNKTRLNVLIRVYLLVEETPIDETKFLHEFEYLSNNKSQWIGEGIKHFIFKTPQEFEEYEIGEEKEIRWGSLVFEFLVNDAIKRIHMLEIQSSKIRHIAFYLTNNEEPYIYE